MSGLMWISRVLRSSAVRLAAKLAHLLREIGRRARERGIGQPRLLGLLQIRRSDDVFNRSGQPIVSVRRTEQLLRAARNRRA